MVTVLLVESKNLVATVSFIDKYCSIFQNLFGEVKNYEQSKFLYARFIAKNSRKFLPAIAKSVKLKNSHSLHYFLTETTWELTHLRQTRIALTKQVLQGLLFILCVDKTGDEKKEKTTDYVAGSMSAIGA